MAREIAPVALPEDQVQVPEPIWQATIVVTPSPGDPMTSSALHGHQAHVWHTDTCRQTALTLKQIFKRKSPPKASLI